MFTVVCSIILLSGIAAIAGDIESGLKVGEEPAAFNVKDITGPNKGKSLCYRCNYGSRPVVNLFVRDVNDELAALVKQVDELVGKNEDKKMAAFVVVLAEDADKVAPQLEELAKKNDIQHVPLTIFDGEAGPSEYKIAEKADITVMMWNKGEVKSNTALGKGELSKEVMKTILDDTQKILN
jgi:hypothetical protein